jgi:hypothetical protein
MDAAVFVTVQGPRTGKIVSILDARKIATLKDGNYTFNGVIAETSKGAYVFVRNFPDNLDHHKIKDPYYSDAFCNAKINGVEKTAAEWEESGDFIPINNKFDLNRFTQSSKLLRTKQVTVDYADFKAAVYNTQNKRIALEDDLK